MSKIFGKIMPLVGIQYYIKHLKLLNCVLPEDKTLSPKEIEVLATFMNFEGDLAKVDRFGTSFRKEAKSLLKLSNAGLTNHITALIVKGILQEGILGVLEIPLSLFPEAQEQEYNFKIIKK